MSILNRGWIHDSITRNQDSGSVSYRWTHGANDDYVDSMTMALIRFRQGGFVTLEGEDDRDEDWYPRKREYY